jgi:hypothetical protein
MKTKRNHSHCPARPRPDLPGDRSRSSNRSLVPPVATLAAIWLLGSAVAPASELGPNASPLLRIQPGPIAISAAPQPARFSFDAPSGKATTASESAANAAAATLETPRIGNAQIEAVVGVLQFVASPFVAGYAAIRGGHAQLNADQLAGAERDLVAALTEMAQQKHFEQAVKDVGKEETHRELVEVKPPLGSIGGTLETRVEELRLYRAGKSDKTFKLLMKCRVSLARASDGAVVYTQPFQYQSGEALFVDWTREDGLASVARTGYRAMALQAGERIFSPPASEPILLGTGQKYPSLPRGFGRPEFYSAALQVTQRSESADPSVRFVNFQVSEAGTVEVFSKSAAQGLEIRGPEAKQELVPNAQTDTEYAIDGLVNHPNFVVQIAGCVGAIPLGLWEHTVGALHGGSDEAVQAAEAVVRANSRLQPIAPALALAIAKDLRPRTSETVLCTVPDSGDSAAIADASSHELALASAGGQTPTTRLELRLDRVALEGKHARNPKLTLKLNLLATLIRASDGQELCTWPVVYRGASLRLKDWAARDARALSENLDQCRQEIAAAITDELVVNQFVAPPQVLPPTMAAK